MDIKRDGKALKTFIPGGASAMLGRSSWVGASPANRAALKLVGRPTCSTFLG